MNQKSQRIRISEAGWATFTGHLGGVYFDNGISAEAVDPAMTLRLGSLMSITKVDTDEQAGGAAEDQRNINSSAPVEAPIVGAEFVEAAATTPVKVATHAPAVTHTRESLEAIADAQGIAGLREIAEPKGIKGRGIAELIEEILADQAKAAV